MVGGTTLGLAYGLNLAEGGATASAAIDAKLSALSWCVFKVMLDSARYSDLFEPCHGCTQLPHSGPSRA